MHWATRYIGLAYQRGAQGPDEWDCWSFFRHVQIEHYQRDIPLLPTPPSWRDIAQAFPSWSAEHGWHETRVPHEGDAVFLGRMRDPTHIGIWLDDLKATLHCCEGSGSVLHDDRHLSAGLWQVRGYYTPED